MAVGRPTESNTYDLIGIGFGPAGIALAVAIEDGNEAAAASDWRTLFIEQAPDSAWQSEMLLPGTNIQHHFLRDFATPRNPRSRFTFPNYLKEKGRLFAFGLLGDSPGRIEWADYIQWVAKQLGHRSLYLHRITEITPVVDHASTQIDLVKVMAKDLVDGASKEFYARNLVLCSGRKPYVPPLYEPLLGPNVFHSHYFKSNIQRIDPNTNPTFAVIGSGQNAIEVLLHLADHFPSSQIHSISRNSGFRLYDLGHFSNQCFFPEEVEYFYGLPKQTRQKLFEEVRFTNYSSVDHDVSKALYWRIYEEEILGLNRVHIVKRSSVTHASKNNGHVDLVVEDLYRTDRRELNIDVVILCTGFLEEQIPVFMNPLKPYLHVDEDDDLEITRDYELRTKDNFQVGLFFSGLTERTHGISDSTSFSMMALRSQRILDRLEAKRQQMCVVSANVGR